MSLRRGKISITNRRKGTRVTEEIGDTTKVYDNIEWAAELEKRSAMSEEEWEAYAATFSSSFEEEPRIGKRSTRKPVENQLEDPKKDEGGTQLPEDPEGGKTERMKKLAVLVPNDPAYTIEFAKLDEAVRAAM
jgi:hypothetical protein